MKQTKRIFSVLLTLCLVLGMLPGVAFAASSTGFTDVAASDWYSEAVQYVSRKGMMSHTGAGAFEPNSTTTRGMIATILYRLEGSPAYLSAGYTDVPTSEWYYPGVAWTKTYNVVNGYGGGKFGPNDPITREQLAQMLFRYSQYKKYNTSMTGDLTKYSDANKISSYDAQMALSWAVGKNLISNVGDGRLDPQGNATRAQVAAILMRYDENVVDTSVSTAPSGWTSNGAPQPAPGTEKEKEVTYTVSFYLNYGADDLYDAQTVKKGGAAVMPTAPYRTDYSFLGWYADRAGSGSAFDFSSVINSDVVLYAKWDYRGTEYNNTYWLRYRLTGTLVWQYWNWNSGTYWVGPTLPSGKTWKDYDWQFWTGYGWSGNWENYKWQYRDSATSEWTDWPADGASEAEQAPWLLWKTSNYYGNNYYWNNSYWNSYSGLRYCDSSIEAPAESDWTNWNGYWDSYYWRQYENSYDDWYWWWYYQNGTTN